MTPADWTVGDRVTWKTSAGQRWPGVVFRIGPSRVTVLAHEGDLGTRQVTVPPTSLEVRTEGAPVDAYAPSAPPAPKNAARLAALERVNARRRLRANETTAAYRIRMAEATATAFGNLSPEDRGKVIAVGLAATPAPF